MILHFEINIFEMSLGKVIISEPLEGK